MSGKRTVIIILDLYPWFILLLDLSIWINLIKHFFTYFGHFKYKTLLHDKTIETIREIIEVQPILPLIKWDYYQISRGYITDYKF